MKRLSLILFFCAVLLSCTTQRGAEGYFDKHTDRLASYVDQNEAYTQQYGAAYASKHFPFKPLPPKVITRTDTVPGPEIPCPEPKTNPDGSRDVPKVRCPDVVVKHTETQNYFEDTAKLQVARDSLKANQGVLQTFQDSLRQQQADNRALQKVNETARLDVKEARRTITIMVAAIVFAVIMTVVYLLLKWWERSTKARL